ncbi:hypothetical protein JCM8097_006386 [Rhodosporidiobolus ruineniae]
MFSTLARGYNSLQQVAQSSSTPQSATATIDKLCDRLLNADNIEDRRAALLGLKGLSRDWKADVGSRALPVLVGVLEEDAQADVEMAKAVVETMSLLCEVEEVDGRPVRDDSGLRNTDVVLNTPTPLHTLLTLLTPQHFYLRFFTLQLLGILLLNRPAQVQQYVLTSPGGVGRLVETLDDSREIIRNESLLLLISLITQNGEIQKLLAFEGAFDKLFSIVRNEGGIGSGGIVVQDCLIAVGGLLRWNVSNQNYFRETSQIPILAPLLLFPRPNALTPQSLSTFAFQSWSEQKVINVGLVMEMVRMLVGGAGTGKSANQKALLQSGLTRCLIELALASNAPAIIKRQALNALADILRFSPDNQSLLTSLIVTPLIPPATPSPVESYDPTSPTDEHPHGRLSAEFDPHRQQYHHQQQQQQMEASRKWTKGEPVPAVAAVVQLAVNGDGTRGREGLRVRAAAANLFENYVAGAQETQLYMLSTMATPPPEALDGDGHRTDSAGSILLRGLRTFPSSTPETAFDSYVPFFASLLFSHLLLHSEASKTAARRIYFAGDDAEPGGEGDEDDRSSLVAILVGNLMMAQREQAQSQNAGLGPERALEWSRVMVGYLSVLSVWLWESPATVKEFLSEGTNLQVLIQPITQTNGVDSVVQGLCAFLLGICYEYNREPGPITRETLHPILQSRVGADQFENRISRLREDNRFRTVGPQVLELADEEDDATADELGEEHGLWFDFAFVEFLKTSYISVQRAILVDPHATTSATRSTAPGSSEVLTAMRETIAEQNKELDELRELVRQLQHEREEERNAVQQEVASLSDTIVSMRDQIESLTAAKDDMEREQEDLLVLLEDLSAKRRADKRKLRGMGQQVSEDEEDEDEDEGEEGDEGAGDATIIEHEVDLGPEEPEEEHRKGVNGTSDQTEELLPGQQHQPEEHQHVADPYQPEPEEAQPASSQPEEHVEPYQPEQYAPEPVVVEQKEPEQPVAEQYQPEPATVEQPQPQPQAPSFVDLYQPQHVAEQDDRSSVAGSAHHADVSRPASVSARPETPQQQLFQPQRNGTPSHPSASVPSTPARSQLGKEDLQQSPYAPSPPPRASPAPTPAPALAPPPPKRKNYDPYAPIAPVIEQEVYGARARATPPPPPPPKASGAKPYERQPLSAAAAKRRFDQQSSVAGSIAGSSAPPTPKEEKPWNPYAVPAPAPGSANQEQPFDPYAPRAAEEEKVHDPFAPAPAVQEQKPFDPYAPLPKKENDPYAPPPASQQDPYAPEGEDEVKAPELEEQPVEVEEEKPEPVEEKEPEPVEVEEPAAPKEELQATGPPPPRSRQPTEEARDPFAPPPKKDDKPEQPQHDPFAGPSHDPFSAPPRDPFAPPPASAQHDPFAPAKHDPLSAPTVRHDPFAPSQNDHNPFGAPSSTANDPFALITHSRAGSGSNAPSHDPFSQPSSSQPHDPFGARPSSPPRDPFGAPAASQPHDPFNPRPASTASSAAQVQHDRILSNPFGLSASQAQDDPYSPFGGPQQNNDPFGLGPSSGHNDYPYSFFNNPAQASSPPGSQRGAASHAPKGSYGDVSSLFR